LLKIAVLLKSLLLPASLMLLTATIMVVSLLLLASFFYRAHKVIEYAKYLLSACCYY
jgi:hypothetical protein